MENVSEAQRKNFEEPEEAMAWDMVTLPADKGISDEGPPRPF